MLVLTDTRDQRDVGIRRADHGLGIDRCHSDQHARRFLPNLGPRKTVKNRMHRDVDLVDPEPTALIRAGATLLREPTDQTRWWVLADPEGNEFCAFPPRPTE
ncbi:VOC family protein [Micromonospora thermarum]|uniref:VOC family protein n=1 Tax=Micromonospora thermarum TaxID=2720024 RepID=UPI0028163F78|nr:VOC family protein [Micromonospora thermarum]